MLIRFRRHAATPFFSLVLLLWSELYVHADTETRPGAPEVETPKTATGTAQMPIASPSSTEVMQAERGVINPETTPRFPLEEPLDPNSYVCGRGDTFELNFWGRQNFRLRVTVDLEGRTFITKVGYVNIVGKTLSEARKIIKASVMHFYPGLNFDMTLHEPRHFLVQVVGFVHKPGMVVANPLERVIAVVGRAGGPTGSFRRIVIERRDGTHLASDFVLYEQTGDLKYNPRVLDGDIIRIPYESTVATISGPVKRPGRFELVGTKDLKELFELAGGFTSQATTQLPMRIIRRSESEQETSIAVPMPASFDLANLANAPLHTEDHVVVPTVSELQRSILLIGPVSGATAADEATVIRRIAYIEGDSVRTLLERTGAIGPSADLPGAYIKRQSGATVPINLEMLLVRRDFSADRAIQMGDTIVIPVKRRSVLVEGAVMRGGMLPFNPSFGVDEYVAIAGGATRMAQSSSDFKIVGSDGQVRKAKGARPLEPGDTILVPERSISRSEVVQLVFSSVGMVVGTLALVFVALKY